MTMPATDVLLLTIFLSAISTAIVSGWLLKWYRRTVRKKMRHNIEGATIPTAPVLPDKSTHDPESPLTLKMFSSIASGTEENEVYNLIRKSDRSTGLIYFLGGLVYVLILNLVWQVATGYSPGRFFFMLAYLIWPAVLTLWLATAYFNARGKLLFGSYAVLLILTMIYIFTQQSGNDSFLSLSQDPTRKGDYFWLIFIALFFGNGIFTLLILAFLRRKIRAVGPLVLTFMFVAILGTFTSLKVIGENTDLLTIKVPSAAAIGLEENLIFIFILISSFLIFGFFGYRLLNIIGEKYRQKQFSDRGVTVDAIWLLFSMIHSVNLVIAGWYWVFAGLIAFAAYKLVVYIGFKHLLATKGESRQLLLLRVFAQNSRSARFFDQFSKWWRHIGNINMISGPDLVTTAIEPHEFLDFISGKLSRQFVKDENDLNLRMSALDRQPDPDGLYRVNEFFCHNNTWRMTMRKLAAESDDILMDLRGFSPLRRGCIYEIEQLLNLVPLRKLVFITDETFRHSFIYETFQRLWANMSPNSPNKHSKQPTIRFISIQSRVDVSVQALLQLLLVPAYSDSQSSQVFYRSEERTKIFTIQAARLLGRAYLLSNPMNPNRELEKLLQEHGSAFSVDGDAIRCANALGSALIRQGVNALPGINYSNIRARAEKIDIDQKKIYNIARNMENGLPDVYLLGQEIRWLAEVLPAAQSGDWQPFNSTGTAMRQQVRQMLPFYRQMSRQDPAMAIVIEQAMQLFAPQLEAQIVLYADILVD